MELYIEQTGKLIASNVSLADTYFKRLKGLMFKETLKYDEGLLITPCNSIHMFFMKFPLDVLFVDKENNIVGMSKNIKPWRISKVFFKAHYVVELPTGTIERLKMSEGDTLFIRK